MALQSQPADALSPALPSLPARGAPKPLLRGYFHLAAALAAPFALAALLLIAGDAREYVGAALYGTSLVLLYGTSATYHVFRWGNVRSSILKRIDHSMVFVLIAGTYTPFCLTTLGQAWGITMLAVVWSLAGGGAMLKSLWPLAPRWLGVGLYLTLGWLAVIAAVELTAALDAVPLALLILGGVVYSAGGFVYATARPDPFPRVFGYHEIFHLLVIGGSAIHYSLIAAYVL